MSVEQILIGKSVAYGLLRSGATIASINDVNNLAHGAMAFFNEDGHFIDGSGYAADFLDSKYFTIAVGGLTDTETRMSKKINRKCNILGRGYVAPVKERMFIGDDGSSGYVIGLAAVAVGQAYTICVEQFTEINLATRFKKHYSYVLKSGDTQSTALTALVALINADADRRVNVTGASLSTANASLRFDFIYQEPLKIYPQDDLAAAAVVTKAKYSSSNAIAPVIGNGTAAQVLELEKACMLNEGDGNTVAWKEEMFSYDTQTDSSATYSQYVISWNNPVSTFYGGHEGVPQILTLAVVTGASQLTQIGALLTAAVSSTASMMSESGVLEENETIVS